MTLRFEPILAEGIAQVSYFLCDDSAGCAAVHCKSGKRPAAFVMMHIGCQENMSGDEVIEIAEEMGFECDQADLEQFVKKYVNNNNGH